MKKLAILFPFLLVSCIPNRLVPYDFTTERNNIEAYVDFDSVSIALTNLEVKGDHYVFGMEIQNKGDYPLFINTEKIRKYAHHTSYLEDRQKKDLQEVVPAMSPAQVNQFFERKKKDVQTAAALLFFVGAAISIYDAVEGKKDNQKKVWTEKDERKSITRDIITSTALLTTEVITETAFVSEEKADIELKYLPNELFTKDVIYPGETYDGKILFRKMGELQKFHRIIFPIGNDDLLFDFRKATPAEKRFLMEQHY